MVPNDDSKKDLTSYQVKPYGSVTRDDGLPCGLLVRKPSKPEPAQPQTKKRERTPSGSRDSRDGWRGGRKREKP